MVSRSKNWHHPIPSPHCVAPIIAAVSIIFNCFYYASDLPFTTRKNFNIWSHLLHPWEALSIHNYGRSAQWCLFWLWPRFNIRRLRVKFNFPYLFAKISQSLWKTPFRFIPWNIFSVATHCYGREWVSRYWVRVSSRRLIITTTTNPASDWRIWFENSHFPSKPHVNFHSQTQFKSKEDIAVNSLFSSLEKKL